jgi:hypothetical protein
LRAFCRWIAVTREEQQRRQLPPARIATAASSTRVHTERPEVAEIVRNLDRPSQDRSRRDFAVVCDLIRLGLSAEEIWPLVASRSKFESNGRAYFDVTIANAERMVLLDRPSVRQAPSPA